MDNDIKKLFTTRDEAVKKQDRKLFLSTQVGEIENSSVEGYFGIKHLRSNVLCIYDEGDLEKIVFVKETYSPPKKDPYSSFPVYNLVKTIKGWKIYKLKW